MATHTGEVKREFISGRTLGLLIATAILYGILALRSSTFVSNYTTFVLSREVAFYVLIALAQAVCLVVGGMNLSVGATSGFVTVIFGLGLNQWGMPLPCALVVALATGALIGAANGLLVTRLKINSFIVTLSMMFVLMGLRSGISGGMPYAVPPRFWTIGQGYVFAHASALSWVFLIVLVLLAAVGYLYHQTVFGRRMLATGGNIDAARLSGISTNRIIVGANILSGLFSALAAVLWASKQGSAAPETGDAWLIVSFAVAIIGGTGLNGGVISAPGILMGAIIYRLIQHGLVEWNANSHYANAFLGALILLTIIIDRVREICSGKRT